MCSDKQSETVTTTRGPVRGFVKDNLKQFLGIPYATPPTGRLRWRPPIPPPVFQEPFDAVAFGNVCAQDAPCFPGFGYTSDTEDCLYLNVFSPKQTNKESKLPVMVLFPGGGLFCGGSNDYDPTSLVNEGRIVFVSMNYRLGIFGFFSHPAINAEDHALGNYGIMDQQLALAWVRDNIVGFGGNAGNVTIIGESAGGISVLVHLASPGSKGLFHRAIVQSGGSPATISMPAIEDVQEKGRSLASATSCREQTAENLRSISTSDILAANAVPEGTFGVGPFTVGLMEDGLVVPRSLPDQFLQGRFSRVPLLIGANKDDFFWFQAMMEFSTGMIIPPETYPQAVALTLEGAAQIRLLGLDVPPDAIQKILKLYPIEQFSSAGPAIGALVGDAGIISTATRRTARRIQSYVADVYVYEFDVPDSPVAWPDVSFSYGSAHAQELQYLFPLFHGGSGRVQALSEEQQRLAKLMVRYWTNFARRGTPIENTGDAVSPPIQSWSAYRPEKDNVMLLTTKEPRMIAAWGDRHHSDFWDTFYI